MLKYFLSLCALILCSCTTVPNIKVCAVAGKLEAGADCAFTNSNQTESMDMPSFIEFLEARENKGPALCMSSEDWAKLKTAIEQMCKQLGPRCHYDFKNLEKLTTLRGFKNAQ